MDRLAVSLFNVVGNLLIVPIPMLKDTPNPLSRHLRHQKNQGEWWCVVRASDGALMCAGVIMLWMWGLFGCGIIESWQKRNSIYGEPIRRSSLGG